MTTDEIETLRAAIQLIKKETLKFIKDQMAKEEINHLPANVEVFINLDKAEKYLNEDD